MNRNTGSNNIPLSIRQTLNARFERMDLINESAGKVPDLYKKADTDAMKTRKGTWKIYIEHDYIPPSIISPLDANSYDRFCAIYFRGSKPYTIIRGNTANKNEIFDFLKKITRKVIEQIPFFSYPKKSLTEENGLSYGIRIGLIFSILIAVFVLFDYMLIPNYPEAFLQGANMSFGIDVNSHPLDSKILEYESITRLIIESIFPPKYRQLSSSMYTLAGIFILPILIFGFFYEIGGKIADKIRMRKLPIGSKTYQYGFNAIEEILKDANIIKNEEIKIECYNKFTKNGLAMEKLDFENLFNEILKK